MYNSIYKMMMQMNGIELKLSPARDTEYGAPHTDLHYFLHFEVLPKTSEELLKPSLVNWGADKHWESGDLSKKKLQTPSCCGERKKMKNKETKEKKKMFESYKFIVNFNTHVY